MWELDRIWRALLYNMVPIKPQTMRMAQLTRCQLLLQSLPRMRRQASTAYFVGVAWLISCRETHAFTDSLTAARSVSLGGGVAARRSGCLLPRSTVKRWASSSDATSETLPTSPFPELHGKTLVSIRECIDAVDGHEGRPQTRQQGAEQPPKMVFVDGSWYHKPDPTTGAMRNPSDEYRAGPRLPRARYLDIDAVATTRELFPNDNPKGLPHMMPPPKLFGLAMDAYDIRNEDHVVVYARRGALFTPRVWFLFLCMGHDPSRVHLMQGSLEDYVEEGGLVETHSLVEEIEQQDEEYRYCAEDYAGCFERGILNVTQLHHEHYSTTTPRYQTKVSSAMHICEKEEVLDAVNGNLAPDSDTQSRTVIMDTRGSGYAKKGHMPTAIHLPYTKVATPTNSLMIQPKEELKDLFDERGINYLDPEQKIILTCGSGVSVCHGYLALKELGRNITEDNTRIYDGSWTEWGKEEDMPKILPNDMN